MQTNGSRWLEFIAGLVLIGNFAVLMAFGNALRSTYLFITRSTVFYPLAVVNLVVGIALLAVLAGQLLRRK